MPVSEAVPARDKAERLITTFAFYGGFLLTGHAPSAALCGVCSNVHGEVHTTCWVRGRLGRRVGQSNISHLENKLFPEGLLGQGLLVPSLCILFVQDESIDYGDINEMIKKQSVPSLRLAQDVIIADQSVRQIDTTHVPGKQNALQRNCYRSVKRYRPHRLLIYNHVHVCTYQKMKI